MHHAAPWLIALPLLMTLQYPTAPGDRTVGRPFATRSPVLGTHGMVCASQPLAARIGLRVLEDGGSAVDAAIATNAALGLVEPTANGIGGDLFVLLWDNQAGRLVGLNGSGRSARAAGLEPLRARLAESGLTDIPLRGALPVTVPGCVDGWFALHERYGKLPMERLLAPAIALAREGFPVSQVIASEWKGAEKAFAAGAEFAEFRRVFLPGGRAPREGELFRNPDLADTYAALAEGGRDVFYNGRIAEGIAACVQAGGGWLGTEDLAAHRSEWVNPVSVPYRGYEVWELPPNGQGIAALQMLRMAEGFSPEPWGEDGLGLHRLIECKKLVYEDRAAYYADAEAMRVPLARLLGSEYAATRRALIDDAHAAERCAPGELALEHGDTTYLSTADAEGNVVSWIQSNYSGFGSGLVPEGLGFGLQDRGKLFSLDPGHANVYAAGKRPFHTIIPAMMTRAGLPVLSFGVMGGAMQPQGHLQIVVNLVDAGMNVQEAGDAPRWRHEGSSEPDGSATLSGPGTVYVESGMPEAIVAGLRARGHTVEVKAGGYGGYQAIWIDDIAGKAGGRVYRGASESRKDGTALGW